MLLKLDINEPQVHVIASHFSTVSKTVVLTLGVSVRAPVPFDDLASQCMACLQADDDEHAVGLACHMSNQRLNICDIVHMLYVRSLCAWSRRLSFATQRVNVVCVNYIATRFSCDTASVVTRHTMDMTILCITSCYLLVHGALLSASLTLAECELASCVA